MTLGKMCHASNMMQVLEKATHRPIATKKACWSVVFQRSIVALKKLNLILKLKVAMLNE